MTAVVQSAELTSLHRRSSPLEAVASFVIRRRWPLAMLVLVLISGMAFSLLWNPLVRHQEGWFVPGDIWATYRAAHFIGWGDIGDIYASHTALVTFPGITIVLAPFAMLTGAYGMSESFPYSLPHPTAWLVLGPVEILLGAAVLIPLDQLAEAIGVRKSTRAIAAVVGAVVVWPVVVMWGHPEDGLALAFAVSALSAALRCRWRACGWLFAAAMTLQPLVVLMVPVLLAMHPTVRQGFLFCVRSTVASLLLLAIPLLRQWKATTHALLQQPNFPSIDHPTPWLFLAPVLSPARTFRVRERFLVRYGDRWKIIHSVALRKSVPVVAAGPGRVLAIVVACAVGLWVWRKRGSITAPQVVWAAAVCLALRCLLESVMDPYYVWPPVALLVILSAYNGSWRMPVGLCSGIAVTVYSEYFFSPWVWYGPVVVMICVCLICGLPNLNPRSALLEAVFSPLDA